jgi:outer membrane protein
VRAQTGVGPRSDVAQAQAFYDATLQQTIDAQNALDDAQLAMAQIVGADPGRAAPLRASIPLVSPQPTSALAWVRAATQDNLAVRAARLDAEAAARDIGAQRGEALPTFALTLSASKVGQNQALGGDQRLDTIGVQFRWPLFSGGAVASAVRRSQALHREAQERLDLVVRQAESAAQAAFRGVVTGITRIGAARQAVESGRKAVEASRRDVEFGTGTEFDLLNAQNNYYTAVRAYDQSRYDYLTNMLSLERQAGRLGEVDLARIDALLVEPGT